MSSQEGFRGQGGGTGSLQEVQNSISSGRKFTITSLYETGISKRAADNSQLSGIIPTVHEMKTTAGVAPGHSLTNERTELGLIRGAVMGLEEKQPSSTINHPKGLQKN